MNDEEPEAWVIVGAGLAGLFAARVLHSFGVTNIKIIEKSADIGGLLQSVSVPNPLGDNVNYDFDYGTHFVLSTGDEDIDAVLYQDINLEGYHKFENSLPEGHVLNNTLYSRSGCPDARALEEKTYKSIEADVNALVYERACIADSEALSDILLSKYGKSAFENIYAPAFEKFTAVDTQMLDRSVECSFFPSRLILKSRGESKVLKSESPVWDARIAFADYEDSVSTISKYYPKKGAIGQWLSGLAQSLRADGVEVLSETEIQSVDIQNNEIKQLKLSDGRSIKCARLLWTIPAVFLSFLTKVEVPMAKPLMRAVTIFHYISDSPALSDAFWLNVYDPNYQSYRVTLYQNFVGEPEEGKYRYSVEVLHDGSLDDTEVMAEKIYKELIDMKVLPKEAQVLWSGSDTKQNAFPVLTPELKNTQMQQINTLEAALHNAHIIGRRPDAAHGQIGVMHNVYHTIKRLTELKLKKAS